MKLHLKHSFSACIFNNLKFLAGKKSRLKAAVMTTLPFLFFLLIAVLFSWPLALHISSKVVATGSGDIWQHLWNIWWVRFSLLDMHSLPYTTPVVFYPDGANLFFHALDPLDGYLSVPLQMVFGLVSAFNLVILFQLMMAGWGTYLLASYLTGNKAAGLVAGLIYECSPLESRLLNLGQLELTSIEWLPLFMLCFIKTLNRTGRSWLWRSLSVGCLLILSLVSWYYLLYALLFSGLYGLYQLWKERRAWRIQWPKTVALLTGIMVVYGLLVSPLLIPTLQAAGSGGTRQPIFTLIYNSATLNGFFTPGPSALWSIFGSKETSEFRGNFLGFVTLGLAGWGLITGARQNWFWALIASIFGILALGPVLHFRFNPDWTPQTVETGPNLPGRLLYNLPFGNIARVPLRFGLVTILTLAVLAAYGLNHLTLKLKVRFRRPGLTYWSVPALAVFLIFLEFFPGPRTLVDTMVPSFYQQLAHEGPWNEFAILETPDRGNASIISKAMYYQTVQGHPMVGGYLSRKPDYPFKDAPGIRELLNLDWGLYNSDILDRGSLRNALGVLEFYKIRYVVVHPELLTDQDSRYNATDLLQTVFGPGATPFYQGEGLQVWKTPSFINKGGLPEVEKLLAQLGEGWGKRIDTDSGPQRLIASQGRLALFNPFDTPMEVKVRVKVRRENLRTSLSTVLNGQVIYQQNLNPSSENLKLTFTLQSGLNELVFKTSGDVYFGSFSFEP